jgi:RND family efflux transporter MFP subunit
MSSLARFREYLTPTSLVGVGAVIGVGSLAYVFIISGPSGAAVYVQPTRGDLAAEVDTTGTVKAADTIALSFDVAGRIVNVKAPVGSHVVAGSVLASLSGSDASAALSQAQAALSVQQAKLEGIQAGSRPESVAVAQAAVSGAQTNLQQARTALAQSIQDSYQKADDAIHNRVDQFLSNPRSGNPTLPFTLSDSSLQNAVISGRLNAETLLSSWQALSNSASDPSAITPDTIATVRTNIQTVSKYLDTAAAALTVVIPNSSYPTATIQTYQTSVATARTNMSSALAGLNTAATAQKSAESALATAQSQLTLTQAPATATDLAAQQAQVDVARANVAAAQSQLSKTVLRAPISGTIARNDAHIGSFASPSQPLITLISDARFQIEAYVSEADLANLTASQSADVSLDAFPDAIFPAHVVTVDPAATMQGSVSSYRVVLQFDAADQRLKAGLTANVHIRTAFKHDALQIPQSALIRKSDGMYVLAKRDGSDTLVQVQTGLVGTSTVEIISGITVEDHIRAFGNN